MQIVDVKVVFDDFGNARIWGKDIKGKLLKAPSCKIRSRRSSVCNRIQLINLEWHVGVIPPQNASRWWINKDTTVHLRYVNRHNNATFSESYQNIDQAVLDNRTDSLNIIERCSSRALTRTVEHHSQLSRSAVLFNDSVMRQYESRSTMWRQELHVTEVNIFMNELHVLPFQISVPLESPCQCLESRQGDLIWISKLA